MSEILLNTKLIPHAHARINIITLKVTFGYAVTLAEILLTRFCDDPNRKSLCFDNGHRLWKIRFPSLALKLSFGRRFDGLEANVCS